MFPNSSQSAAVTRVNFGFLSRPIASSNRFPSFSPCFESRPAPSSSKCPPVLPAISPLAAAAEGVLVTAPSRNIMIIKYRAVASPLLLWPAKQPFSLSQPHQLSISPQSIIMLTCPVGLLVQSFPVPSLLFAFMG